ncbi:hypothetical protein SAMN02744775_00614 [Enterobacter sp. CC120223-11]|nr:hypothetical protein SAMN02744775_00614 [Enterobacter sp. CC120223-11]
MPNGVMKILASPDAGIIVAQRPPRAGVNHTFQLNWMLIKS